jgi:hypothetical protein
MDDDLDTVGVMLARDVAEYVPACDQEKPVGTLVQESAGGGQKQSS